MGLRAVPALPAGEASAGTASVTIPNGTPLATYYFLACADDVRAVPERDETNNCRASATPIQVGRPDLLIAAVTNPSASAIRAPAFSHCLRPCRTRRRSMSPPHSGCSITSRSTG